MRCGLLLDWTYIDVNVSKTNCAVGNEACIESIEIGDGFHVRNEARDAGQKNDQNHPNDHGMEPLVMLQLLQKVIIPGIWNLKQQLLFVGIGHHKIGKQTYNITWLTTGRATVEIKLAMPLWIRFSLLWMNSL